MIVHTVCLVTHGILCIALAACDFLVNKDGLVMSYNVTNTNSFCLAEGNKIATHYGISISDCVLECGLRNHCRALSYHRKLPSCLLLGSTDKHVLLEEKCEYVLKSDITVHTHPCVNECDDHFMCDQVSEECVTKECVVQRPNRSTVIGNRLHIGSKVKYKCNLGLEETNSNTGVCLNDGNWSHIPNCTGVSDCDSLFQNGYKTSGVYDLQLTSGKYLPVRCDMSPLTGGWIVIQRRLSASDFYKTWDEYKVGFGNLNGNFWIGNENIWTFTKTGSWQLRVDLTLDNEIGYAEYSSFSIGDEISKYVLSVGGFSGNIGDSLAYQNGMAFTTKDRDNDMKGIYNCAVQYLGAWWYNGCHASNLNGDYGNTDGTKGLSWLKWKNKHVSVTTSEMKIKKL